MAVVRVHVTISSAKLDKIRQLDINTHPAFRDFFNQTALRYRRFTQERYDRLSRGLGTWAGLSPATIKARLLGSAGSTIGGAAYANKLKRQKTYTAAKNKLLKNSGGKGIGAYQNSAKKADARFKLKQDRINIAMGRVMILRDTGTMFRALSIGTNGASVTNIDRGIAFGFASSPYAPVGKASKATLTYKKLYGIHHYGTKRIPARPILVRPDEATLSAMAKDASVALRRVLDS